MPIRGNEENTLQFIQDYKSCVCLWDSRHQHYYNRSKRRDALDKLSKKHSLNIVEVKNKIKCLRSYFTKEYQKVTADKKFQSSWFAYDKLKFILEPKPLQLTADIFKPSTSKDNDDYEFFKDVPDCREIPKKLKTVHVSQPKAPVATPSLPIISSVAYSPVKKREEDDFTIFGRLVANQIRKLNRRNQAIAKNTIQNFLFDLEMREIQEDTMEAMEDDQSVALSLPHPSNEQEDSS